MTEETTTFSTDLGNITQQPEPVVEPVDANAKTDVNEVQGDKAPTGDKPGVDETPAWQKREITKERNRRRAAEEALEAERQKNADLAKALADRREPDPTAERPKRPRPSDFFHPEDFEAAQDEYDAALSAFNIAKAKAEIAAERNNQQIEQAQYARASEMQNAWQRQLTAAKAKTPDVEDVLADPDFAKAVESLPHNNAEAIAEAITTDENGVMIMYHLASNPDEAARIFALKSPAAQVREIGKIAANIGKPNPVSKAPPPINPVRGAAPAGRKTPAEETYDEYSARRLSEMQARRERAY